MIERVRLGPRAKQRDATRARLLKVARRLFGESGYDQVSVGDLCQRAKVTHGALYHHFPAGKPALLAAVVAEVFAELGQRVSTAVAEHHGWDGVRAACDAYLDACADAEVQSIVFRDGPRVLAAQFDSVDSDANAPLVTSLLREWMARGLLRPRPVVMLARLLGALFEEAGALLGEATDRAHTRAQVDALLGDWLAGLRRAPGELPDVLVTDRLVLEPWSASDLPALAALFAKDEVRRFLFDGESVSSDWTRSAVAASERRFSQGLLGMFLARDGQRAPIGAAGFARLGDGDSDELVVLVDPSCTRRGYGYELADVVLREATARGCSNTRAHADEGNVASARLLEQLGFVRWAKRGGVVEYVRAG
jgi:RimJ/RimL family protein N-acetyltransferase